MLDPLCPLESMSGQTGRRSGNGFAMDMWCPHTQDASIFLRLACLAFMSLGVHAPKCLWQLGRGRAQWLRMATSACFPPSKPEGPHLRGSSSSLNVFESFEEAQQYSSHLQERSPTIAVLEFSAGFELLDGCDVMYVETSLSLLWPGIMRTFRWNVVFT